MNIFQSLISRFRFGAKSERHPLELSTSFFAEDILLRRLLKTTSTGTYVDVGANHPIEGSNTFRLYMDGWSGLTIEPNPKFGPSFRRHRPRDIHVIAGVTEKPSLLTYHTFDPDVFNTFSARQASEMVKQGRKKISETIVPCIRLADAVAEHLDKRPIDVLNVDCEGLDIEVLRSLDLATNRPTVIVVEDAAGLRSLRDGGERSEMDRFLRLENYSPIAQSAWSAIFVANDWRDLVERSSAFDRDSMRRGYMP